MHHSKTTLADYIEQHDVSSACGIIQMLHVCTHNEIEAIIYLKLMPPQVDG